MISEYDQYSSKYGNLLTFSEYERFRNKNLYLVAEETYSIHPRNYNTDFINQYRGYITYNSKFINDNNIKVPKYLINGFIRFDDYEWIDSFVEYDKKINGICCIANQTRTNITEIGDITYKRLEAMNSISGIIKHTYGRSPYGGEMYRGRIGSSVEQTWPSSKEKLKKLSEYKFNLCFENCYHETWSWDYITEKITDTFKSKTVSVYYGCYNIENHIPKELYVDFRDFKSYEELSKYLAEFPKDKYIEMTENAFEFIKKWNYGKIENLIEIIEKLK